MSRVAYAPLVVDSVTKNKVGTPAILARLNESLGAMPTGITGLGDGMFNIAYLVVMPSGERFVVKIAPPPEVELLHYETDLLSTETSVLRLLDKRTSLPIPAVVYASSPGEELGGADWFAMEYVPGVPASAAKDSMSAWARDQVTHQLGCYLRELHQITNPLFGYPGLPDEQSSSWQTTFRVMLEALLADGQRINAGLPMAPAEIRELAAADYPALDEVTTPVLVHWDLWEGNVLLDGIEIAAIIDCERALWADPLMEYNFCSLAEMGSAFFEGYRRGGPGTAGERARRRLYDLYLYLILVIETYYRNFEPNDQLKWAYPLLEKFLRDYPRSLPPVDG